MSSELHRRRSSREDDADGAFDTAAEPTSAPTTNTSSRKTTISSPERPNVNGMSTLSIYASGVPQRQRVLSTPSHPNPPTLYSPLYPAQPPSAGPFRSGFAAPLSPALHSPSHFRHARSPSASPFYLPAPSPLSMSFQMDGQVSPTQPLPSPHRQAPPPPDRRRHARIHSRNLSIYFPRPGTQPPASIAEDGAQELEIKLAPETIISSAPLQQGRELQRGFRFGGKKAPEGNGTLNVPESPIPVPPVSAGVPGVTAPRTSRKGHHHKHSLSHNFFSFMEPETSGTTSSTAPATSALTSFPSSPWQSISAFPTSSPTQHAMLHPRSLVSSAALPKKSIYTSPMTLASIAQFALGSALWVQGQQCGSLACTELGYWVVFDAFGVAFSGVLPSYLASLSAQSSSRHYGNARIETLAVFAQSIYLIFSSVYVSKEAVEHMLLSHGEGHHHHHRGDDAELGLEFPILLLFVSLLSLILTNVWLDNHSHLINASANHLPSFSSFIQSFRYPSKRHILRLPKTSPPTSFIGKAMSNPFTAVPIVTALGILSISGLLHVSQHRAADLFLAGLLAVVTLSIAYPAALVLAKVLLQTAPGRGISDGRMDTFLRTMRDIERHPQVVHLPPPHIWQLTPTHTFDGSLAKLIVTLELHVRGDVDDTNVLELTKWAWERCMGVLGGGNGGAEVTVGVVKG